MTRLTNPYPLFLDLRGALLDSGFVYLGAANSDPEANPIAAYWDEARAIPAAQPLRTRGGYIVNGANLGFVYIAEANYSMTVRDADSGLVSYIPSAEVAVTSYQPLNNGLSAIAAAGTTPFGIGLLSLANASALRAATGIPDGLATTGGTVSGNITRVGAGSHLYHVNPAYTSGRVYGPEYTTDPTTAPGDIWFKQNA